MRFLKYKRFRIGLRTIKTAVAVSIAMLIVTAYGATTSKLIFAMLGAMAAMEPTLKESFEACLTQIVGLILGVLAGVVLLYLPLNPLLVAGIGIIFVITFYNLLQIRFSPALSCLMVVTICTTSDIMPFTYGLGRLWDTTIGLAVGMFINTLVFPYDTSRRIQTTAECLDKEVITFLEDMFDGDEHLPNTKKMSQIIDEFESDVLDKIIENDDRRQLYLAIRTLPITMRETLMESTYLHMKDDEIATLHHLTPENVRQIRSRAKKKLTEMLKEG